MTNFAADIRQWKSVQDFANHLKAHNSDIASWADGVVIHHTYRPLQSQWNGRATVEGLKNFYIGKGWSAGPHLFVVANSPNPENDGIWQLTPLNLQGVHARQCNPYTWGIEVVGDYQSKPWDEKTKNLVVGAAGELCKWRGISVNSNTLKGHRDCNSTNCPGQAINMDDVRLWTNNYLAGIVTDDTVTKESSILATPRCTIEQATNYILNRNPKPIYTSWDLKVNIMPWYWQYCEQTGVDPCITIAQMIHETGNMSSWWSDRPRRNPAGIGVTGETSVRPPIPEDVNKWAYNDDTQRWHKGVSFPNWVESSLAHVGRLCAYATFPDERTLKQKDIVNKALKYRTLPLHLHGVSPTLEGLNGRWAYPGTTYADKIALIANAIIATQK